MSFSTSFWALSTISSILAGCILPSTINFSSAILATSLLIGSKLDNITASGVSSIIKSTPVNVSIVLIFRPSLPIILPFISSFGNGTTCTVDSETWSAAQRWIAVVIISLAFLSASSFALDSISFIISAASWDTSLLTSANNISLASSEDRLATFSNSSLLFLHNSCTFKSISSISRSLLLIVSSFFSKRSLFLSRVSSLWITLLSSLWTSFLLSRDSLSKSLLSLWTSSFASKIDSFLVASASRVAFLSNSSASFSKILTLFFVAVCISL